MALSTDTQKFLEKNYSLGRGYMAAMRLNFQHQLLRQLLGYNIHPDIAFSGVLPENPRIADVGTGTGQWLIDVSHELPSATVEGFDISKEQFPSSTWLPAQISMNELDIFQPIPSHLEAKFDVVNVRFFICVVTQQILATVLKELCKMLKPGGLLQWVEYDRTSAQVISTSPSLKKSATERFVKILREPHGTAVTWPSELQSHFEVAGFQQILSTEYPIPPELYAPFMQCYLSAAEETSFTAMRNDGPEAEGPTFRRFVNEVYDEHRMGVSIQESPIVVIGQKPIG